MLGFTLTTQSSGAQSSPYVGLLETCPSGFNVLPFLLNLTEHEDRWGRGAFFTGRMKHTTPPSEWRLFPFLDESQHWLCLINYSVLSSLVVNTHGFYASTCSEINCEPEQWEGELAAMLARAWGPYFICRGSLVNLSLEDAGCSVKARRRKGAWKGWLNSMISPDFSGLFHCAMTTCMRKFFFFFLNYKGYWSTSLWNRLSWRPLFLRGSCQDMKWKSTLTHQL